MKNQTDSFILPASRKYEGAKTAYYMWPMGDSLNGFLSPLDEKPLGWMSISLSLTVQEFAQLDRIVLRRRGIEF